MNEKESRLQIIKLIQNHPYHYDILKAAETLKLKDWCIGAGFIRNLVWDFVFGKTTPTKINDIDLVYYDSENFAPERDVEHEQSLKKIENANWSVKNQARMHIHNQTFQYLSTEDAIAYWPELETAIGIYFDDQNEIRFIAPFGTTRLFDKTITRNSKTKDQNAFTKRIEEKKWLELWNGLEIKNL